MKGTKIKGTKMIHKFIAWAMEGKIGFKEANDLALLSDLLQSWS